MSSWAKVGAKVVCVNAQNDPGFQWFNEVPVEGAIYRISGMVPDKNRPGKACLLFEEMRNGGSGFAIHRFRPLTTKTQEQDVSMFKGLLNKTPINETA